MQLHFQMIYHKMNTFICFNAHIRCGCMFGLQFGFSFRSFVFYINKICKLCECRCRPSGVQKKFFCKWYLIWIWGKNWIFGTKEMKKKKTNVMSPCWNNNLFGKCDTRQHNSRLRLMTLYVPFVWCSRFSKNVAEQKSLSSRTTNFFFKAWDSLTLTITTFLLIYVFFFAIRFFFFARFGFVFWQENSQFETETNNSIHIHIHAANMSLNPFKTDAVRWHGIRCCTRISL